MLKFFTASLLSLGLVLSGHVSADTEALKQKLESAMPSADIRDLREVRDSGLYEAQINGQVVYFTADGKYLLQGEMVSIETRENLTENRRIERRTKTLAEIDTDELIIFAPDEPDYTLTVFTDIDCGYCREMHQQIEQYNDLGIAIRYLAFPRNGLESESFDKAEAVWCADDRHQAMTDAKNGERVEAADCDSPVSKHYNMGRNIGVRGTPAMFTDDGQSLPGYVPPKRLKEILDEETAKKSDE